MILLFLVTAWVLGILLAAWLALPAAFWLCILLLPFAYLALSIRDQGLRLPSALALLLVLGALRYQSSVPSPGPLAELNGQGPATVIGLVEAEPETGNQTLNIDLGVSRVRTDGPWRDADGRVLVQAPRDTAVGYGDQVEVYGELTTPPAGADFSYRDFLARSGVFSLLRARRLVVMQHDLGSPFLAALYGFRSRGVTALKTLFPEPSSSLLSGILLGYDREIPPKVQDAFNSTSTGHIIAISGFNIAIIAGLLGRLGRRLPPLIAHPLSIAAIVAYTLLVGASASVVRAAIMGILVVAAQLLRRQAWARTSLAAAVLCMTLLNPFALWDLGFQLSFMATLGLVLYSEPFTNWLEKQLSRLTGLSRAKAIIRFSSDSVIVTFIASLFTAPLIAAAFQRFSLVGFLTNLLVLPVQPYVMIFGGLALLVQLGAQAAAGLWPVALVLGSIAQVVAAAAYVFTQYTILVVQWSALFPLASIQTPRVDLLWITLFYAGILLITQASPRALGRFIIATPTRIAAAFALLVVAGWSAAHALPDPRTHVQFVAARTGEAVFIQTASGSRILIDGTGEPGTLLANLGDRTTFWDRRVDLLILTNLDESNIASLNAVLERYDVGQVLEPPRPQVEGPSYKKWRGLLEEKAIPSVVAAEGIRVQVDELALEALAPIETSNNTNVALRLATAGHRLILASSLAAADLDSAAQGSADWSGEIAALPHKFDPTLLNRIDPATAILFAGEGSREQPAAEALALLQGRSLLRTDERGNIEVILDGPKVEVRTER